ncbi:hypothetical protein T07_6594 [Trichinella nelsoni]|uniref:Uncharacterized protein n=1 Tax=Trichinella nelsoni TaxID=6336 RepID=A0A0V0SHJ5_9BILA|nr:hypothetical protein T07_6594 [Trichinella nelsoni]
MSTLRSTSSVTICFIAESLRKVLLDEEEPSTVVLYEGDCCFNDRPLTLVVRDEIEDFHTLRPY